MATVPLSNLLSLSYDQFLIERTRELLEMVVPKFYYEKKKGNLMDIYFSFEIGYEKGRVVMILNKN